MISTIQDFEAGIPRYIKACAFMEKETVKQKESVCRMFLSFMQGRESEQITQETMIDFRNSMGGLKPTTINKYLSHLRTAFGWLLEMGLWDGANPVRKQILVPVREKEIKSVLTEADMLRIAREPPETWMGNKKVAVRRRAVTLLLLTSAMRESELVALRPCDLDWEKGVAYIANSKGGKDRNVLFSAAAQQAVRAYLDRAFCRIRRTT